MTVRLVGVQAIARFLSERGREAMIAAPNVVAVRAAIDDYPAHVNVQLRSTGVARIGIGLPVRVPATRRTAFAMLVAELNQTRLGVGFMLTESGVGIVSQVPLQAGDALPGEAVDRSIDLAVELGRAGLADLRRLAAAAPDESARESAPLGRAEREVLASIDDVRTHLAPAAESGDSADRVRCTRPVSMARHVDLEWSSTERLLRLSAPLRLEVDGLAPQDVALAVAEVNRSVEFFGLRLGPEGVSFATHVLFDEPEGISTTALERALASVYACELRTAIVVDEARRAAQRR